MKIQKIVISILFLFLFMMVYAQKKYSESWESLKQYTVPEWFRDAKFGIFIHWGVYSVPAYGSEWYPRFMYMDSVCVNTHGDVTSNKPSSIYEYHIKKYGPLDKFGYKDFIPMFKGEKFNPEEWVNLFVESGAKYVIPVAEHHDGFAMYASNITEWNSLKMGPKRDVLGELMSYCREKGLKTGASSHYAWNWHYFMRNDNTDVSDPRNFGLYGRMHKQNADIEPDFLQLWWARTKDLIDNYKPDILWFDFCLDRKEFAPYHKKLAAYYYNSGLKWNNDGCVLTNKNMFYDSYPEGVNVYDVERGKLSDISKYPWQSETSIGANSWGYVENWKSRPVDNIIDDLLDVVSKNGNLLLNVGPKSDGTIPEDQIMCLKEIGHWLKINGEAIYGTRPWYIYGEGPTNISVGHHSESKNKKMTSDDIRFTSKGDILYATVMEWPENGIVKIRSLGKKSEYSNIINISAVELLGYGSLKWKQKMNELVVFLPKENKSKYAYSLKIY